MYSSLARLRRYLSGARSLRRNCFLVKSVEWLGCDIDIWPPSACAFSNDFILQTWQMKTSPVWLNLDEVYPRTKPVEVRLACFLICLEWSFFAILMQLSGFKGAFSSSIGFLSDWRRLCLCVGFFLMGGSLMNFWVITLFFLTFNLGSRRSRCNRYELAPAAPTYMRIVWRGSAFWAKFYGALRDAIYSVEDAWPSISLIISFTLASGTVWGWILADFYWAKWMGFLGVIAEIDSLSSKKIGLGAIELCSISPMKPAW